jgi:hypothetical protein
LIGAKAYRLPALRCRIVLKAVAHHPDRCVIKTFMATGLDKGNVADIAIGLDANIHDNETRLAQANGNRRIVARSDSVLVPRL